MTKSPFVSIIIITMNHEKFIAEACESAAQQDYDHFEIIVLDNNSSDKTFEIATATLSKFPVKHKLIKNSESFGVAKNLNILVSHTSGEYISILSGDDWYTKNHLREKVSFFQANTFDFILTDGFKYYQETGEITDAYSEKGKKNLLANIGNFFHYNVSGNKTVNVGTFVSKKILTDHPFDEEIQTEDWDMNLRLSSLGYRFGFLDKKLFYYRILPTSLSRNWAVMKNSYEKVTSKYLNYIRKDKDLNEKYLLNLLHFKYEIKLSKTDHSLERKRLKKEWKREKYRIKYKNPLLFFKLLFLK
ncbi:glycosyl transferase [Chryseobacterium sp. Leaf180]|uniref:glycosyltransferase family 2 protein n=1 Tax=Chryseobacterium sp. Leaf180 TaxID=1736289 RepID=UPI0006FD91AB|nr:glycosyltransferase family 2 protein [Chryseobacterium sp. Leaf180]KQR93867.1 glycosyl transferase [Chryseobacterium sp. Leaf180]